MKLTVRERERRERERERSGGDKEKERSAGKWWKGRTIADSKRERERSEALQTSAGKCEALHPCLWVTGDSGYRKSSTTTISSSPL